MPRPRGCGPRRVGCQGERELLPVGIADAGDAALRNRPCLHRDDDGPLVHSSLAASASRNRGSVEAPRPRGRQRTVVGQRSCHGVRFRPSGGDQPGLGGAPDGGQCQSDARGVWFGTVAHSDGVRFRLGEPRLSGEQGSDVAVFAGRHGYKTITIQIRSCLICGCHS
jgi:hypothetical protein